MNEDFSDRDFTTCRIPQCDICKALSGTQQDATSKCLDCSKLLCIECVQLHRQTAVLVSPLPSSDIEEGYALVAVCWFVGWFVHRMM